MKNPFGFRWERRGNKPSDPNIPNTDTKISEQLLSDLTPDLRQTYKDNAQKMAKLDMDIAIINLKKALLELNNKGVTNTHDLQLCISYWGERLSMEEEQNNIKRYLLNSLNDKKTPEDPQDTNQRQDFQTFCQNLEEHCSSTSGKDWMKMLEALAEKVNTMVVQIEQDITKKNTPTKLNTDFFKGTLNYKELTAILASLNATLVTYENRLKSLIRSAKELQNIEANFEGLNRNFYQVVDQLTILGKNLNILSTDQPTYESKVHYLNNYIKSIFKNEQGEQNEQVKKIIGKLVTYRKL